MGMGGSGRCRPDHILPCIIPEALHSLFLSA
jgi:hypothetical protein